MANQLRNGKAKEDKMRPIIALFAFVSAATLATSTSAQTVIDDSAARFPPDDVKAVLRLVGAQLRDPVSAQIRGLKQSGPGYYCGYVNAKTTFGGYAGFRAFVVGLEPIHVGFSAPGNEGQFERSAFIISVQDRPGKHCADR
jgi:hypothetical protein